MSKETETRLFFVDVFVCARHGYLGENNWCGGCDSFLPMSAVKVPEAVRDALREAVSLSVRDHQRMLEAQADLARAEAEVERLTRVLEEIAGLPAVTHEGTGADHIGVIHSVSEASEIAQAALANDQTNETEERDRMTPEGGK